MNNFNNSLITSKIAIASDHAGYSLKSIIINSLKETGCEVIDFGADDETPVDYPEYADKLTNPIASNSLSFGILICGSGIGMSICANRKKFIRAALCHNKEYAKLSRQHNDANVLVLGARFLSVEEALDIVSTFFTTEFSQDRHKARVDRIDL